MKEKMRKREREAAPMRNWEVLYTVSKDYYGII
jgi:hypothetical protein